MLTGHWVHLWRGNGTQIGWAASQQVVFYICEDTYQSASVITVLSAGSLLVPSVLPANLTRMQANSQPSNEEEKKSEKRQGEEKATRRTLNQY